jgi:nitric oxide dioxygenase
MVSALRRVAEVNPQRRVIFAHAARDAFHHALRGEVDALAAVMPNLSVVSFYENKGDAQDAIEGRMDVARLPAWPVEKAEVYLCGPHKFMQAQWLSLLYRGVPAAKLHREVFGPELLDHLL